MKSLDIADVARHAGVKPSALRYYESLGLIAADSRKGLRRQYDASVLDRLALIALGQRAGFSLQEIAETLGPATQAQVEFELDRNRITERADEVDRHIRALTLLARALRHVATCQAPSHAECPSFRKMMAEALKWSGKDRQKI
ncbi:Redox-sensitive transcriptional activator SoxR [Phaeobacter sp. CECT 5382]|uniref:helix-turn-helix domain-containing protein n=1 Tax=Phaeobacter sp. CECT 5382 TaxID=1712645 RepID=UPI0006D953AC|nr:helix-turn-helix domain-containing protein [Phaeobacter sp. CECT 5382]CUH87635.1 Redox-sensitive transcriptional activator SoxR [Phaeobacter sp. CECT 5382]